MNACMANCLRAHLLVPELCCISELFRKAFVQAEQLLFMLHLFFDDSLCCLQGCTILSAGLYNVYCWSSRLMAALLWKILKTSANAIVMKERHQDSFHFLFADALLCGLFLLEPGHICSITIH